MLDPNCLLGTGGDGPNTYQWTNNSVNSDTAMGMSWFH